MNPEGRKTCQWKLSRVIAHVRYIKILTRLRGLNPVQTKATLLTNNSQHCWMLYAASVCTTCCMFLRAGSNIVGSCWIGLHTIANNSQHSWPNNVGSCCVRLHLALGTKLQIFQDSIVLQFPAETWAQRKPNQNRKMTRKPWSHVRLWNVGYLGFTTERILVLRDFITMIPPHSISEL